MSRRMWRQGPARNARRDALKASPLHSMQRTFPFLATSFRDMNSTRPRRAQMHAASVRDILNLYNPANPLEQASTIPAPWYRDPRIAELERASVFGATWQVVGRV